MTEKIPKLLLIGAGRFGENHLRVLLELEREKKIKLVGVAVRTRKTASTIKKRFGINPILKLDDAIIRSVDAVDIVTPASTHFDLVKRCLKYTNVFVEKPLALSSRDARELCLETAKRRKKLAVGHIFRFNLVVLKLKELVKKKFENLYSIEGKFTGSSAPALDCGVIFSDLHHFDILDFILEKHPKSIFAKVGNITRKSNKFEDEAKIILTYDNKISVFLELNWVGFEKTRTIDLFFKDLAVYCDLLQQKIEIRRKNGKSKIFTLNSEEPLKIELQHFINVILGKEKKYPDGEIGARIIDICENAQKSASLGRMIFF